ncbi:helix-turn-helix transcriptional regulator [Streptomyces sp. H39-S7]|uniref:helix-turn-helix transcriptional regulator n=1 Tax=Streptomyces sp. H39-S7 TaxID=3004357 RepID=UPI0022AF7238|nr:helix-turn-helix transcriptional regulator [Streptomyces sp. H39-S7]MCZ4119736.1 helix-turn-helix transcriptional regulator [Streptomyces sp. H39-S7]
MTHHGPVGLGPVLAQVGAGLAAGSPAVLWGVRGSGRTTFLDALADAAAERGDRPLRLRLREDGAPIRYGALTDLLAALDPLDLLLPAGPLQSAVDVLLRRRALPREGMDPVAVRLALGRVLARASGTLLLIDDVQWMDHDSVRALAHVLHSLPRGTVRVAVTRRCATPPGTSEVCGPGAVPYELAPLDVDQVALLLERRALPGRWAARVHAMSGGNPALTVAVARELRDARPGPAPVGASCPSHAAASWPAALPAPVTATLLLAALAVDPSSAVLRRAGCERVDADLALAAEAGIVSLGPDGSIAFRGTVLRDAVLAQAWDGRRSAAHRALATAVEDPVEAVWHRALAADGFDAGLAAEIESAATDARRAGQRSWAGELELLAARRTPPSDRAHRLARLAAATTDAAAAGRSDLAGRVAAAVRVNRGSPAELIATLLAVVDSAGQAMEEMDQVLTQAAGTAEGHPSLMAAVEMRVAVKANVCEGRPDKARAAAARAAALGRQGRDAASEAAALTMRARMERILDDPAAERTLRDALALDVSVDLLGVRSSPQYLAARHAVFDDRLPEARAQLLELLGVAERQGVAADLEEVLRSLAEVDARAGSCAQALRWSDRASAVCVASGLSPGPVWYTAALAETAGGSFTRATEFAARAARTSHEEHDMIFASRSLLALGTVQLITGSAVEASRTLERVAALERQQQVADPRILRWRPELVEALAVGNRLDEAEEQAAEAARITAGYPDSGVFAALQRARAHCAARRGECDTAAAMLHEAAERFGCLRLPIEEGRTRVALGVLERARRRPAAARTAWKDATGLFRQAQARPWTTLTQNLLDRLEGTRTAPGVASPRLTEAEHRLALLVVQGLTNHDAAATLFLSVKTVESTLSRVYRKLGIRSRTQLAAALRG